MPSSTGTPWNLPSPTLPEQPDGPGDLGDLAASVHAALGRAYPCVSTARPDPVAGMLIFETDTLNLLISPDGSTWRAVSIPTPPKLFYGSVNVTLSASGSAFAQLDISSAGFTSTPSFAGTCSNYSYYVYRASGGTNSATTIAVGARHFNDTSASTTVTVYVVAIGT